MRSRSRDSLFAPLLDERSARPPAASAARRPVRSNDTDADMLSRNLELFSRNGDSADKDKLTERPGVISFNVSFCIGPPPCSDAARASVLFTLSPSFGYGQVSALCASLCNACELKTFPLDDDDQMSLPVQFGPFIIIVVVTFFFLSGILLRLPTLLRVGGSQFFDL